MEENSKLRGMEAGACKRLQSMEEQVKQVVAELEAKEEQLASERDTLQRFRDLEKQVGALPRRFFSPRPC